MGKKSSGGNIETAVILIDTIPKRRCDDRSAEWSRFQKGFLCSVAPAISSFLPLDPLGVSQEAETTWHRCWTIGLRWLNFTRIVIWYQGRRSILSSKTTTLSFLQLEFYRAFMNSSEWHFNELDLFYIENLWLCVLWIVFILCDKAITIIIMNIIFTFFFHSNFTLN